MLGWPRWVWGQPQQPAGRPCCPSGQPWWPGRLFYPGRGQPAEQGCGYSWASRGCLPKPCQRVAASRSARAQRREGVKTQPCLRGRAMLHPAHRCVCLYKAIFCFPFQKERCQSLEADVFIKTCISKPDMRSAASGAAEKQSVNTLERVSQRGRRGTGPAPVPAKSYKRRESQTQAEQTFSIHSVQYLVGASKPQIGHFLRERRSLFLL